MRSGSPTAAFWGLWRADKDALVKAGVSVGKDKSDNWRVSVWSEISGQGAGSGAVEVRQSSPQRAEPDNGSEESSSSSGSIFKKRAEASAAPFVPADLAAQPAAAPAAVKWSTEQEMIFAWFRAGSGHLVVKARAGTGKTTTIKQAFTHAPEQEMCYVVFNKKNQKEAQDKITDTRVDVKTLHSLGYSYLKQVWRDAAVDDEVEGWRVEQVEKDVPTPALEAVLKLVGFAKNTFVSPTLGDMLNLCDARGIFCDYEGEDGNDVWSAERLAKVALKAMELARQKDPAKRVSFNDMVWLPVAMNWVKPRYDLVVVDECQDMNVPQLEMAKRACRPAGRICVVGDDRQAIYGFRGAAQDGMSKMQSELKAAELGLTTTYRCPKSVVALAAALVPDYKAAPEAPEGVISYCSRDELKLEVGDSVLSRLNAPLMSMCLELLRRGTPARIEGRDIGRQLCGLVKKMRAKSVPDFLRKINSWGDKQERRLNVGKNGEAKVAGVRDQVQTLTAVAEGCANVGEVESRLLALFQDTDAGSKAAVVLSSVHKAKGLEFDRVAILEWTFNSRRKNMTEQEFAEEKNIRYVAITRTKRELVLVSEGGKNLKPQPDGTKAGAI